MNTTYEISGMTCQGCVKTVQSVLQAQPEVKSATVSLTPPQAQIEVWQSISLDEINAKLAEHGNYHMHPLVKEQPSQATHKHDEATDAQSSNWLMTYRPLIMIIAFIAGTSALAQWQNQAFDIALWMRHFMAGFFIVFAFFKLLNLQGFANAYKRYDLLAARWGGWSYVYPFVELALGVGYLINFNPVMVNVATIVILGFSAIGVIRSNLRKDQIKCACLGDVFDLPMSTITIIEDLGMVAMAAFMLL